MVSQRTSYSGMTMAQCLPLLFCKLVSRHSFPALGQVVPKCRVVRIIQFNILSLDMCSLKFKLFKARVAKTTCLVFYFIIVFHLYSPIHFGLSHFT